MVLFGELVINPSRMLWDEEDYAQEQTTNETLQWDNEIPVPENVLNLFVVETTKLTKVARSCLEEHSVPICSLSGAKVEIHRTVDNNYMVLCQDVRSVCTGEVTEKLIPWLERASRIVAVTSSAAAMFCSHDREVPQSFIRALTIDQPIFAPKLEICNIVAGIVAGVLSYCQFIEKKASLYICYLDARPLDSITVAPILQLFEKLEIPTVNRFKFTPQFINESNLYM